VTFCLIAYPIVCHIDVCVVSVDERLQTFDCTNEGRILDERDIHFVVSVSDESGNVLSSESKVIETFDNWLDAYYCGVVCVNNLNMEMAILA